MIAKITAIFGCLFTFIVAVIGAVYFLEDRYYKTADAKEMAIAMEKRTVETFQAFQLNLDRTELEAAKDRKVIIEKLMQQYPNDTYFKLRYNEINQEIQRLERKVRKNESPR